MNVNLGAETERKLRHLAQQRGISVDDMLREWIERELTDWVIDPSRPLTEPNQPSPSC